MKRKLLCCSIAVLTTLSAVLALGNAAEPSLPNSEDVSIDVVNEYLLENGFSEEFIESTAEPTKRQLYVDGGVFENDIIIPTATMMSTTYDWQYFAHKITVSNLRAEENQSRKSIIYNWSWDTMNSSRGWIRVYSDALSLRWGGDYEVILSSPIFSIFGRSERVEYEQYGSDPTPPKVLENQLFITRTGNSCISDYNIKEGVAYKFNFPLVNRKKIYYGRSWGLYELDLRKYNGTYSITIERYFDTSYDNIHTAIGNYYRYTEEREIDFSLNISLGGISIDISSEESEFLFPSEDCRVQFYSFS